MSRAAVLALALACALAAGGCAFAPKDYPRLDESRALRAGASAEANVARFAAAELRDADEMLARAGHARDTLDDAVVVDHLAYVAKQRLAIAREAGELRAAEETMRRLQAQER